MPAVMASLECRLLDACIVYYSIRNGAIDPGVQYYNDIGLKPGIQPTQLPWRT